MTPDERLLVERLFHAALAYPASEREAFLTTACGGNERIRSELASLLAQNVSRVGPLDGLAVDVAAAMLVAPAALRTGQRIGAYEVLAPLGTGGSGQVYRARDTVLRRDVAIKVLSSSLGGDPPHLERIEREARVLASLNHPNIASIYGLEVFDQSSALILELVEGETLARRIARSSLGVSASLQIARQLCDGLMAAHERGIVHRDLKPGNVMITPGGVVKLLDFGLARVVRPQPNSSPVFSSIATGAIAGTPAYMSPEQARGQPLDHRADIWAFGCVLYEMLSGRPAFDGETASDTVVGILEREPSWRALPDDTPEAIRRLLVRCLHKDSTQRLRDIGDARLEIEDALRTGSLENAWRARLFRRVGTPAVRWTAILAACAVAAGAGAYLGSRLTGGETAVTHSLIALQPFDLRKSADTGGNGPAVRPDRTAIALSPDGRTLVWQARDDGGVRLYRRSLDSLDVTAIDGTEGADSPFFSPDSGSLGFRAGGELRRVSLAGGLPTTITSLPIRLGPNGRVAPNARIGGASWGDNDQIVFATGAGDGGLLWQVSARGGEPQVVAEPGEDAYSYRLPQLLPGGEAVLFTAVRTIFWWNDARIVVRSLTTGEQKTLLEHAADGRYVPTGHLVFMRDATMMAVGFDEKRLEVTGEPVALVEDVMQSINSENLRRDSGAGQFAISSTGTLAYVTGGIIPQPRRALVWIDREGNVEKLPVRIDAYYQPRLSPNGRQIAAFTSELGLPRIWSIDPASGARTAVTSAEERGTYNVWTLDDKRIAFMRSPRRDIYWKSADGTGSAELLYRSAHPLYPASWHPDGNRLAVVETNPSTGEDIWIVDVADPERRASPLARSASNEFYPEFSPDGRWIAYASNDTGLAQVYVQPYPGPGQRITISANGGTSPVWREDGKELFYIVPVLTPDGDLNRDTEGFGRRVVAVSLARDHSGALDVVTSRVLFEETSTRRFTNTTPTRGYDVTRDGKRFLMVQPLAPLPEKAPELVLVQNWFTELQRLVPR